MPDDENDGIGEPDTQAVEQPPALVINCEPLLARLIEMTGRDGVVYRLRDDVPTDRLLWAFGLLDIAQAVKNAQTWEEREQALDDRDRERLNVVATIVRHSYPQMTRAVVARVFTVEQMEELLGYFFTSRLLPLLEQRIASVTQASQQTPDNQPTEPAAAKEVKPNRVSNKAVRRAASVDAIPTPKR